MILCDQGPPYGHHLAAPSQGVPPGCLADRTWSRRRLGEPSMPAVLLHERAVRDGRRGGVRVLLTMVSAEYVPKLWQEASPATEILTSGGA